MLTLLKSPSSVSGDGLLPRRRFSPPAVDAFKRRTGSFVLTSFLSVGLQRPDKGFDDGSSSLVDESMGSSSSSDEVNGTEKDGGGAPEDEAAWPSLARLRVSCESNAACSFLFCSTSCALRSQGMSRPSSMAFCTMSVFASI